MSGAYGGPALGKGWAWLPQQPPRSGAADPRGGGEDGRRGSLPQPAHQTRPPPTRLSAARASVFLGAQDLGDTVQLKCLMMLRRFDGGG